MSEFELITIIGPTACGKTTLAVALAHQMGGEIISADSRQVYRGMDIGTGKDLSEYKINGEQIPYHLIDICKAGEKYNVFRYQHDFQNAYREVREKNKIPVLCGGTGMYIEAVLKAYNMPEVPENKELRQRLNNKSITELSAILRNYKSLHNTTDIDTAKRAIRAIEIADYTEKNETMLSHFIPIKSLIIGIDVDRETRRRRITQRLINRLEEGLIDEVKQLLSTGVTADELIYYGLEYKFVTQYILGELTYNQMFSFLEIAIHQFSKRQMTWFRGMEKRGLTIHWIPYKGDKNRQVTEILQLL